MRNLALALVAALVATLGTFSPGPAVAPASAATSGPKIVIVVGATHGATSTFRTRADAAYAEAIKYTSNVVKVYSPNATWAAVKSAIQGASIVIYMGHGNGFPSPYRTTPWPYSQNGFGLNAVAGQGDDNTTYYGEHYIGTEVKLAPNAVVLLHHLCYASGNSEPGHAEPTLSVAKQRADNYAAGFLKAGARAVIADGHMGPAYYLRSLFTTRQTVDQMWRTAPNFNNNAFSFESVRSPGYTIQMDPETPSTGYLRSIGGNPGLRTDEVIGGAAAPTDGDPAAFTVPGNASVVFDGAGVFADATLSPDPASGRPVATLPLETPVRLLSTPDTAGTPAFEVATQDGTIAGYMAASDLKPRDSTAAEVGSLTAPALLSPNGDGRLETATVAARLSETASWRLRVWRGTTAIWSQAGEGTDVAGTWNGTEAGVRVADGSYTWTLDATDSWGNASAQRSGTFRVDTVGPHFSSLSLGMAVPAATFSPNRDGRDETLPISWQITEAGTVEMTIRNSAGTIVRQLAAPAGAGAGSVAWDGKSASGAVVPDGLYRIRTVARDAAGNYGKYHDRTVAVFTALSRVAATPVRFYPQDGDRLAATTTLSFVLSRPATVTWRIRRADGTTARTLYSGAALAAGTHTFTWDGRDGTGRMLPVGNYTSTVDASADGLAVQQRLAVSLNAFSAQVSDTTPAIGQTITVTATSAEPVSSNVNLHVTQPGIERWGTRMTLVSGLTYRATVTLRPSSTGTVTFRISALDVDGRFQVSYLNLPLQ